LVDPIFGHQNKPKVNRISISLQSSQSYINSLGILADNFWKDLAGLCGCSQSHFKKIYLKKERAILNISGMLEASLNGFLVLILNLDFFLVESFVTGTFANLLIHLGLQYRLCSEAQLAG